jgi:hypothetical protein
MEIKQKEKLLSFSQSQTELIKKISVCDENHYNKILT